MKIDIKNQIKDKTFWLALIPAVLLLIQAVAAPFGYKWDISGLGVQLTGIVNAIFTILSILGIVSTQTTPTDVPSEPVEVQQSTAPTQPQQSAPVQPEASQNQVK